MKKRTGYLYLIVVFIIWGSLYAVSKYAMAEIPPFTVLLFRYLIGAAALFFPVRKIGFPQIQKGHFKYFLGIGVLGYTVSIGLQLIGTKMMDASLASLISSMNPVAMIVMAAVFLREKLTVQKAASLIVSISGVYVILGGGRGSVRASGAAALIGAVLLWSAASILIRKISGDYDPVLTAFYGMLIAILFTLPASLAELHDNPCTFTVPGVLSLIYLGVVCTALAHTLWNKSLSMLDAGTCSMFFPLQPLTSAVMGILFLGEKITANYMAGAVLISAGIVTSLVRFKSRKSFAQIPVRQEAGENTGKNPASVDFHKF